MEERSSLELNPTFPRCGLKSSLAVACQGLGKKAGSAAQSQQPGPRLTPRWRPVGQRSEQTHGAGVPSGGGAAPEGGSNWRSAAAAAAAAAAATASEQLQPSLVPPQPARSLHPPDAAIGSSPAGQESRRQTGWQAEPAAPAAAAAAMTLMELCLPQQPGEQQPEQEHSLQTGHPSTEQFHLQGEQPATGRALKPKREPRQSSKDYSSRQCRQCGSVKPGSGLEAAWQAHPTTGQRWLCQPCFAEAQQAAAQGDKGQDSRRQCRQCGTTTPGIGTPGSKGAREGLACPRRRANAPAAR